MLLNGVLIHAGHLHILVKGDTLGSQLLLEVFHHSLGLQHHHILGNVGLDAVGYLLHQRILKGVLGSGLALVGNLLLQVGLQFLQRVKLGHILGKLIVNGGDFLHLDLVDLHMEYHRLTGKLRSVVLGEGDVNVLLLAHLHAHELILKTGHEAAGANLQVKILALAAIEGHAVVKALKVDVGGIALLYSALHAHQAAVALGHFL